MLRYEPGGRVRYEPSGGPWHATPACACPESHPSPIMCLRLVFLGVIPKARRHGLRLLVSSDTIPHWHRAAGPDRIAARAARRPAHRDEQHEHAGHRPRNDRTGISYSTVRGYVVSLRGNSQPRRPTQRTPAMTWSPAKGRELGSRRGTHCHCGREDLRLLAHHDREVVRAPSPPIRMVPRSQPQPRRNASGI